MTMRYQMLDVLFRQASLWAFVAVVMLSATPAGPALAQSSSLPGLIVTVPSSPPPAAQKPATKPASTNRSAPPKRAAPPKRKSAPRSRAKAGSGRGTGRSAPHKIVLLVNDDPITNYEIDQRAQLLATRVNVASTAKRLFGNMIRNPRVNAQLKSIFERTIQENQGKSREQILAIWERRKRAFAMTLQKRAVASARNSVLPGMRKKAEQELIEERLKLQAARKLNITIEDARIEKIFADIAKRNKMSPEAFAARMRKAGTSPEAMKQRFRVGAAWNMVIRRQFSRYVNINQRQVDQFLGEQPSSGKETLSVHKITLPVPSSLDQRAVASQYQIAERMRSRFGGCRTTQAVAAASSNAKFQDLGQIESDRIGEPTRSMLLAAKTGEMLPPTIRGEGIVLYAVCGRTSSEDQSLEQQQRARRRLQAKELEVLAKRHLADLKRDAHIERR